MRGSAPALALLLALVVAAPASAHHGDRKKAIWGPATPEAFRIYHDLGVGIYQSRLTWAEIAPTRPANPTDPTDPAYRWPAEPTAAIREARRYGIRVLLQVSRTPAWANAGQPGNWVPTRAADLADFVTAAARRYRYVRHWMVWGEPTRQPNFMPLDPQTRGERLTPAERWAPRKYARMLDKCYAALKAVRRRNVVIGGNTFSFGDIGPLKWIREMRLPNGERPRMDLYGHNPFTLREPRLQSPPELPGTGFADFSDLDSLYRRLGRYGYRDSRGKRLRIFISEFTLPTDKPNRNFNFYVTQEVQARWTRLALRIVRRHPWLYSLGWIALIDQPRRPDGLETNWGLIDLQGRRKPAFDVFRDG